MDGLPEGLTWEPKEFIGFADNRMTAQHLRNNNKYRCFVILFIHLKGLDLTS